MIEFILTKVSFTSWSITILLMGNLICLCDVWKGRSYVNVSVSVSLIFSNCQFYIKYYFLLHINLSSKRFSVSIVRSLFLIFLHQNTKSTAGLNIYSILEEHPKGLLKMFLINVTETSSRRHFREHFLKWVTTSLFFQYWL